MYIICLGGQDLDMACVRVCVCVRVCACMFFFITLEDLYDGEYMYKKGMRGREEVMGKGTGHFFYWFRRRLSSFSNSSRETSSSSSNACSTAVTSGT